MRGDRGTAAFDDLSLLAVAVLAFSIFFASLTSAHVVREERERGERLQAVADSLLAATLEDDRWTGGRGLLVAESLNRTVSADLAPLAEGRRFRVVVWDLRTDQRWVFGGELMEEFRTAFAAANVLGATVNPARVVATVGA